MQTCEYKYNWTPLAILDMGMCQVQAWETNIGLMVPSSPFIANTQTRRVEIQYGQYWVVLLSFILVVQ